MEARRTTVIIKAEALSIKAARTMALKALEEIDTEYINGELIADDGDNVTWTTTLQTVAF